MQDDHCGSRTEEHAYTAGIIVNIYIRSTILEMLFTLHNFVHMVPIVMEVSSGFSLPGIAFSILS